MVVTGAQTRHHPRPRASTDPGTRVNRLSTIEECEGGPAPQDPQDYERPVEEGWTHRTRYGLAQLIN